MSERTSGQPHEVLRPSVLQRLLGVGTRKAATLAIETELGIEELKAEVMRDLEVLLNTRSHVPDDLREFPLASNSILTFGLPDFSSRSAASTNDISEIRRRIAAAVQQFEPRLDPATVEVESLKDETPEGDKGQKFTVCFRIRATLDVKPILEDVSFDTEIAFDTGAVGVVETT